MKMYVDDSSPYKRTFWCYGKSVILSIMMEYVHHRSEVPPRVTRSGEP